MINDASYILQYVCAHHFSVVAGVAWHWYRYGHGHRHPSLSEQHRWRDQFCRNGRQQAPSLALPDSQLPWRQRESGAIFRRCKCRVPLSELRNSRRSNADSNARDADSRDAVVTATAAVHAGLEVVVTVVFQTSVAAVYNEAEHAGELQETVPLLLLPVMQLVCPLL